MKLFYGLLLTAALSSCSTSLPINYVPSCSIRGDKSVAITRVLYQPAESGKVEQNQFQQASMSIGRIYLSDTVPELIRTSLRKELVSGGFSVEQASGLSIEADVTRFMYDWVGYIEVDFYLDISFRVKQNESIIFSHKSSAHQKAPKTGRQDTEAVRAAISKCLDDFLISARSKRVL